MIAKQTWVVAAIVAQWSCAPAQQDAGTLDAVAKTIGASGLTSIQYSATGFQSMFGQGYTPNGEYPKFHVKYSRAIDYAKGVSREETVRTQLLDPPQGAGGQPLYRESRAVTLVGDNSEWAEGAPVLTPHGFVQAALANKATVASQPARSAVVTFTVQGKYKVNGYINAQNLVERTETWTASPHLGDMPIETSYSAYQDFGGIQFPTKIVQKVGGFETLDLTVSAAQPNAAVALEPPPAPKPQGPVALEKIADGVWYLRGMPEPNSQLIEFTDFLVVVESSYTEERAIANMEAAAKMFPNKPIRYHINSHHHRDHIAGVRTFVADGTTIVTSATNQPFYEQVLLKNPHTIVRDRLTERPRAANFVWVDDRYVITDGSRRLEVYTVPNGHANNLLMSYLPNEKVLCISDIFNDFDEPRPNDPPPGAVSPYTAALGARIKELNLDIRQVAPAHGRVPLPVDVLHKRLTGKVLNPAVGPIGS